MSVPPRRRVSAVRTDPRVVNSDGPLPAPPINEVNTDRLHQLANGYGATHVQPLPALQRPSIQPDFGASTRMDNARGVLATIRRNSGIYKDPTQGVKGLLRSSSRKDFLADPVNWTFSLNERRDAIDQIVRGDANAGLIQAIMEYKGSRGFDVNIRRQQDNQDPQRRIQTPSITYSDWLQQATRKGAIDAIRLFASRGGNDSHLICY